MIKDYSNYSGINIDEINEFIKDSISLIKSDSTQFNFLKNSKNIIYDYIKMDFNINSQSMIAKFQLFSPYMLSLVINSNYNSVLDMSGIGMLSRLINESNPNIHITYNNINTEISQFTKWLFDTYQQNIGVLNLDISDIIDSYDVIISDGNLQYFNKYEQENRLYTMISKVNKNGLLCLLVDISGYSEEYPIRNDVDIIKLHSILEQSDMVCIYGKNSFSSLWKKMI